MNFASFLALLITTQVQPLVLAEDACIVLIGGRWTGGSGGAPVEYLHPSGDDRCNYHASAVRFPVDGLRNETWDTAGCYLSESREIFVRENWLPEQPPMVYKIGPDAAARHLRLPYKSAELGFDVVTYGSTASSVGGSKCISCGGYYKMNIRLNNCYEVGVGSEQWTEIAPMPKMVNDAASVVLGDQLYVVGGIGSFSHDCEVYRYSLVDKQWHYNDTASFGPQRMQHAAAALSDTEMIVCGGLMPFRLDDMCYIYNATENRWRDAGPMNLKRRDFSMVNFNGQIYAIGGVTEVVRFEEKTDDSIEVYDRISDTWSMLNTTLKHARYDHIAVVV